MIKCVDERGAPVDGALRNPASNAVVFEMTDKYKDYMREKNQLKRIAELEDKVNKMMEFMNSALNK